MTMTLERLLHSQGFGTRRECRALVRSGAVAIAGCKLDDPFAAIDPEGAAFSVRGEPWRYRAQAYVMLHKPVGYECSREPRVHRSVFELLPAPFARRNVQPVGRLDQDTTGLLLLSDDGQFIHKWSSGRKRIPKTYAVTTAEAADAALVERLLAGVDLHDEPAPIRAAACRLTGERALALTITEGKYHQVKRMIAAAGNAVAALHRLSVGGLELPADLPPGEWRWLEADDLRRLEAWEKDPA